MVAPRSGEPPDSFRAQGAESRCQGLKQGNFGDPERADRQAASVNRQPYRPIVIVARFTGLTGADERQLDADELTAAAVGGQ